MITNKISVNNKGVGRDEVFIEIERFSDYLGLSEKNNLHIRLLTEETLGMVAQIGGDFDAEFWAESEDGKVQLCLSAKLCTMNSQKREKLLKASTSGKNAAAESFTGKIKNAVEIIWLGY